MIKKIAVMIVLLCSLCASGCAVIATAVSAGIGYAIYSATHK